MGKVCTNAARLRNRSVAAALLAIGAFGMHPAHAKETPAQTAAVAVGAQYDTTHVYVASADFDAFVSSFAATFDGKPGAVLVTNVLPVASRARFQAVTTSAGSLSAFAYETPIPYPFGQERTGYLVTDMDAALQAARAAGAEVVVAKFRDPIGLDAVIQWPGGVKMQLYWHFTAPSYAPLATIPDNRVYVSPDAVSAFVDGFLRFSHGRIRADDKHADAREVGRPGETYRRIDIESKFGRLRVLATDGHLPYPYGHEVTGFEVQDLAATLAKATAADAKLLVPALDSGGRRSAMVEFPGGFIAELHALKAH